MYGLFITCAAIGGSILLLQFLLNLIGFAGDSSPFGDMGHADVTGDVAPVAGDFVGGHDALGGHDFDGPGGPNGGHDGSHHGDASTGDDSAGGDHYTKVGLQLARYITLQTLVAFFTFFGLGGWAALEAGRSNAAAVLFAFTTGVAFMFGVGYAFGSLRKLEQAGNECIRRTVGCRGRVYLRIPGEHSGVGKATITSQGRTIELKARTPGPELKTGSTIQVSKVLDWQTVEVVPVSSTADVTHAAT